MAIYVSGSIAFDNLMQYAGRFEDQILPDKISQLNISFLVEQLQRHYGGTGGNIAYNLALLGEPVFLLGAVGSDFDDYRRHLESCGVSLDFLHTVSDRSTAACFITADQTQNQITAFHPGAMSAATAVSMPEFLEGDWLIVAPDAPDAMVLRIAQAKTVGVQTILDIGQQAIAFDRDTLLSLFDGPRLLIGNQYEIAKVLDTAGLSMAELLERVPTVIMTRGQQGSTVYSGADQTDVGAVVLTGDIDPTGAGDAFRAGLLYAARRGASWVEGAQLGSVIASYVVVSSGTQNHRFSQAQWRERFIATYDEFPAILAD